MPFGGRSVRPLCAVALHGCSAQALRVDAGPMVGAQKALRRSLCTAAPGWAPFPLSAPKKPYGARSARPLYAAAVRGRSAQALLGVRRTHGRRPKTPSVVALRGRSRVGTVPMIGAQKGLRRPHYAVALRGGFRVGSGPIASAQNPSAAALSRRSRVNAGPMVGAQKALRWLLCAAGLRGRSAQALLGGHRPHGRRPKIPSAVGLRGRSRVGAVPIICAQKAQMAARLMVGARKPFGGRSAQPLPGGFQPHGRYPNVLRQLLCAAAPGWAPLP